MVQKKFFNTLEKVKRKFATVRGLVPIEDPKKSKSVPKTLDTFPLSQKNTESNKDVGKRRSVSARNFRRAGSVRRSKTNDINRRKLSRKGTIQPLKTSPFAFDGIDVEKYHSSQTLKVRKKKSRKGIKHHLSPRKKNSAHSDNSL